MARPTSRCAMAKRVTESIISITSRPRSRKCSAIAVAGNAAFRRTSAGWSDVAQTTTERARPSGPRSRCINSRTSRPRSPTRQMTLISAEVERAIMPSSDDLPTPEPAKMPRRWPRPQGTSASSARTPSDTRSSMRGRERGSGGEASAGRHWASPIGPLPSRGRPRPSRARPSSASETSTLSGRPLAVMRAPGPMPVASPSAISSVLPARKPTTSAGTAERPRPVSIEQTSPTSASTPVDSMIRPMRSLTRPWRRCRSASRSAESAASKVESAASISALAEGGLDDLSSPLELRLQARVDVALGRAHDRAAPADAALGLDLAVLDAAERGDEVAHRPADQLEVVRMDQHGDALTLDEAPQGPTDGPDDELGIDGDGGGHDLLGQEERELHGTGLETLGCGLGIVAHRLGGLLERRGRRRKLGE